MVQLLVELLFRPMVAVWLQTSRFSWRRSPVANDSPHVHAPGTDPDRVLLAGDGAATGRGVLTHDLGLPGCLARSLTGLTGRATDVDVLVTSDMTAVSCTHAVAGLDVSRFDAILLTVGANEALALVNTATWKRNLTVLLDGIGARTGDATHTFVMSIPFFGINPHFPALLARVVDHRVARLNAIAQELVSSRAHMTFALFAHSDTFEKEGAHVYQRWAAAIAPTITEHLDSPTSGGSRAGIPEEIARQQALAALGDVSQATDPVLERIAGIAKSMFGTDIGAVTFIESDAQRIAAAVGATRTGLIPRAQSFCDLTIRRAAYFAIEDTHLDHRYANYAAVTGEPSIRFYAGYPIESPDGHRIGALCIMDTRPRTFTTEDATLLRTLAQRVQKQLWETAPSTLRAPHRQRPA